MMKPLYKLFALTLLIACTTPGASDNSKSDSNTESITIAQQEIISNIQATDSLSYIGFINKFENSDDFYTDIYFIEGFNYADYDKVRSLGDSIIFRNEELKRVRIPTEKVKQYFILDGLNKINIYNRNNELITTGELTGVEYVEDVIESRFVAVFKLENPGISDYQFCIGNIRENLSTLEYSVIDSDTLTSKLIKHIGVNNERVWRQTHYKLSEHGNVYSIISADTTAFIIETLGNKVNLLYKSESSEFIYDLSIVSKEINGKPILLTFCGLPETDITWTSLLIFNGVEYKVNQNNVKIE
ncbi:MAG: hypothetical protein KF845_09770 [Cyclobacteriaceae bacterium]|nr:hypothetical protein [Cyclobacteriaceae bacterium]